MARTFIVVVPEDGTPRIEPIEENKICTIANVGDVILDIDTMESLLDEEPAEKKKNSFAERLKKLFSN